MRRSRAEVEGVPKTPTRCRSNSAQLALCPVPCVLDLVLSVLVSSPACTSVRHRSLPRLLQQPHDGDQVVRLASCPHLGNSPPSENESSRCHMAKSVPHNATAQGAPVCCLHGAPERPRRSALDPRGSKHATPWRIHECTSLLHSHISRICPASVDHPCRVALCN